jgi:hypothetical protein
MPAPKLSDCFSTLQLKGNEKIGKVRSKYIELLKEHYPTTGGDSEKAREIIEAFKVIAQHFGHDPSEDIEKAQFLRGSLKEKVALMKKENQELNKQLLHLNSLYEGKTINELLEDKVLGIMKGSPRLGPLRVHHSRDRGSSRSEATLEVLASEKGVTEFKLSFHRYCQFSEGNSAVIKQDTYEIFAEIRYEGEDWSLGLEHETIIASLPPDLVIDDISRSPDIWHFTGSILEPILKRWGIPADRFLDSRRICERKKIPMRLNEIEDRITEYELEKVAKELKESISVRQRGISLVETLFSGTKQITE